ncbi:MAG: hypothetical protein P4L84_26335 [Isosphaeraceae bacterium]|nr:hypothetical protein [Isosphaeraceae bacterium]
MSQADGPRLTRLRWIWPAATVVLGYIAGNRWLHPLARPKGYYGGYYRYSDIEIATVLTILWLVVFAVTLVPAQRRRGLALRLGTLAAAALVTAAFCDIAYTAWSIRFGHVLCGHHAFPRMTTQPDPELIFKHKPGVAWHGRKTSECQLIDFRTDENGFRNPPGIRQADVVFIGDSVTEAGEVSEELTFARQTADALGKRAVNLGVFCYGPQQELAVLKRYGLGYNPRVVVWQITEWNDIFDAEHYFKGATDGWKIMTWKELYENHSPVVRMIAKLFPPTPKDTVEFVRSDGIVDRRVVLPYFNPVPASPAGLAEALRVLGEAHELCRERGIALVVLLVPAHDRVLAPYVKARSVADEHRYRPPGGLDVPNDFAHVLTEFCGAHGCAFVDVTDDLRQRAAVDNRDIFVKNDTHLGADGHGVVARALSRCLTSPETTAQIGEPATRR